MWFFATLLKRFSCKFRCTFKKTAKTKKITNLRLSISSIFFKAKINIDDAPAAGKQSTMDYDLAKKFWYKMLENTAIRENRNEKLSKF